MSPDYYAILGIPHNASADEIKKAYRRAIKRYHPDQYEQLREAYRAQGKEHELQKHVTEAIRMTQQLNEAYAVLSDHTKRFYYNRTHVRQTTRTKRTVYQRTYSQASSKPPATYNRNTYQRNYTEDYTQRERVKAQHAHTRNRYVRPRPNTSTSPTSHHNLSMPSIWSLLSLVVFVGLMARLCTLSTSTTTTTEREHYLLTVVSEARNRAQSQDTLRFYYEGGLSYLADVQSPFDDDANEALNYFTRSIQLNEGIIEAHRERGFIYYARWQMRPRDDLWQQAITDLSNYQNKAITIEQSITDAIAALCAAKPPGDDQWCD